MQKPKLATVLRERPMSSRYTILRPIVPHLHPF